MPALSRNCDVHLGELSQDSRFRWSSTFERKGRTMKQRPAVSIDPPAHQSGFFVSGTSNIVRAFVALILAIMLGGPIASVAVAQSTPDASPVASPVAALGIDAAVDWLIGQQDESGGFIGFSGEPDAGLTIDAVLAIASAPGDHTEALTRAEAFLVEAGPAYAEMGPGQAGKLVLALVALGQDPVALGLSDIILASVPGADEAVEGESAYCGFGPFDHAICMLALIAADAELPIHFVETLVDAQIENGGWAFDGSSDVAMADSNTTALAIQALIAAGIDASDATIQNALGYLATLIDPEQGGFAYDANNGLIADANSTAVVIQALIAANEDASSDEWGRSTVTLAGFQNDSGAFRYQHEFPDDNIYATVQAIPALAGLALPINAE
jgi:hypothetical protein